MRPSAKWLWWRITVKDRTVQDRADQDRTGKDKGIVSAEAERDAPVAMDFRKGQEERTNKNRIK